MKRVKYSREALAAKKERDQAKLRQLQELTATVLAKVRVDLGGAPLLGLFTRHGQRKLGDLGEVSFNLTTRVLQVNPEFYTIWNYRRKILLDGIFPARYVLPSIHYLLNIILI